MSSKARYYKIGVFVLIGFILTVVGVIFFGAGKFFRKGIMIETYFEQSVQGLDVGAPVKFQGVKVGNVKQIAFVFNYYQTQYTYVMVRAEIYQRLVGVRKSLGRRPTEEQRKKVLKELIEEEELRLQLDSTGITGVGFLNMVYLDPKRNPPLKIDWQPEYSYIPSSPGTLTLITKDIQDLARELASIDIKGIANKVDQLLVNTNKVIEDAQIDAVSKDIRSLLSALETNSKNLNSIMESKELRQSLKDLSQSLANIDTASKEFPNTLAGFNTTLGEIKDFTLAQQRDLAPILEDLRQTMANLRELTGTAKKYPSWILFGNPPPHLNEVNK
jgi:phospholipid/cholesterol/gamma-HCH transport system substrate-binding protein